MKKNMKEELIDLVVVAGVPFLAVLALLYAILSFLGACDRIAFAQGSHAGPFTRAEVHAARLCVNEQGFEEGVHDCLAILNIVKRNAAHLDVSSERYLLRFHRDVTTPYGRAQRFGTSDRRPWIAHLSPAGSQPARWSPSAGEWVVFRARWGQYLAWAATVLRSAPGVFPMDPCRTSARRGGARIWGSPSVDRVHIQRRLREGAVRVQCGPTLNVFMRF